MKPLVPATTLHRAYRNFCRGHSVGKLFNLHDNYVKTTDRRAQVFWERYGGRIISCRPHEFSVSTEVMYDFPSDADEIMFILDWLDS
jgi:hypothetical protein